MQGKVKWFNAQKGYGFLVDSETKKELFIHYSQILINGFKLFHEDDMVEYELGMGNGRQPFIQAVEVKPILTMKMIKDSLKEEKLYVKTLNDPHAVCHLYIVVNDKDELASGEQGMSFLDLAAYAGFDTEGLTE